MKVLSVAGYHHTGKTTAVVNIISELKKRRYKVVSIKDIHAENFTMEKVGSNTWKHWEASDDVVFARSLRETYQIWHQRLELNEMLSHLNADYVVVEGMRSAALPRIICAKNTNQLKETVDGTVFCISGIYADSHSDYNNLPVFSARNRIDKIVDLIEEKVFPVLPLVEEKCCGVCGMDCRQMVSEILSSNKNRDDCIADSVPPVHLTIDERTIKLVPYVQSILSDTVYAFLKNLKGFKPGKIKLEIVSNEDKHES